MSFSLGNNIKMSVRGASHSEAIEVKIEGLPKGEEIDLWQTEVFLKRRQGGNASYTTARKEADTPIIESGLEENRLNGEPLCARFLNSNQKSGDYGNLRLVPRPSHADYVAYKKYHGKLDMAGGGFFSGRMTLPMCFAGSICKQLLEQRGILLSAHILSVGDIKDDTFDSTEEYLEEVPCVGLPVLNPKQGDKMVELMESVSKEGDSVGGCIECKVVGLPAGIGDPIYDSLESLLSFGLFGIPAIKGIEFGQGFDVCRAKGSESNDPFIIKDGEVKTLTNNSGGIQGGISNGMPIIFRVAVKPTPSIYKPQKSVNLQTMEETTLQIEGRHDSCIVPRVVPCVEAMCSIVLLDAIIEAEKTDGIE